MALAALAQIATAAAYRSGAHVAGALSGGAPRRPAAVGATVPCHALSLDAQVRIKCAIWGDKTTKFLECAAHVTRTKM